MASWITKIAVFPDVETLQSMTCKVRQSKQIIRHLLGVPICTISICFFLINSKWIKEPGKYASFALWKNHQSCGVFSELIVFDLAVTESFSKTVKFSFRPSYLVWQIDGFTNWQPIISIPFFRRFGFALSSTVRTVGIPYSVYSGSHVCGCSGQAFDQGSHKEGVRWSKGINQNLHIWCQVICCQWFLLLRFFHSFEKTRAKIVTGRGPTSPICKCL
jgi:hypothetical protein